jgi:hypothetical protein
MYTSFVYVVKDHTSGRKKKRSKEFVGGRRSLARVSERLGDLHKTVAASIRITGSPVDWASGNRSSAVHETKG